MLHTWHILLLDFKLSEGRNLNLFIPIPTTLSILGSWQDKHILRAYTNILLLTERHEGRMAIWLSHWTVDMVIHLKKFFNVYFWERGRQSMSAGRGRERAKHRIRSRLQTLSCEHRARCGSQTHRLQDHDLNQSRMLNWLSHPGAPW